MQAIARPAPSEYLPYYGRYIDLVGDDVVSALRDGVEATRSLLEPLSESRGDHRYEPGKWSVKEVLGHVIDTERVFVYRALRFARKDPAALPGFDQDAWVPESGVSTRTLKSLVEEHRASRASTIAFLEGLAPEAWERVGTANDARMSVRAAAWVIAGHELHHRNILRDRYLR